jgi:hypothetical protein
MRRAMPDHGSLKERRVFERDRLQGRADAVLTDLGREMPDSFATTSVTVLDADPCRGVRRL